VGAVHHGMSSTTAAEVGKGAEDKAGLFNVFFSGDRGTDGSPAFPCSLQ
jgi:hypothetical protein